MGKTYLVITTFTGSEVASAFDTHSEATKYINEATRQWGNNVTEITRMGNDSYMIAFHNNIHLIMEVKSFDSSAVKFHLAKYENGRYIETRRFSTRENAVKFVENAFDKYDYDVDEDETEIGEWNIDDEDIHLRFVLLITILNDKSDATFHEVLGVKRNATKEEIKTAYRKKARESHPDVGGSPEQFKRINEAYNKLINDEVKSGNDDFSSAYSSTNVQYVMNKGFGEVAGVVDNILLEEAKKVATKKVAIGAAWAIGGGALTAITYNAASDGGTYLIFWGAIIFGIWDILRGLYWLANPQALVDKAKRNMNNQ